MRRSARFIVRALALSFILVAAGGSVTAQTTEFGTQRHETIIVQTFDARSPAPDTFNYYLAVQDRWHGARELAFAYLWETDTGTGATVNELAAEPPQALDASFTRFRVKLRKGVFWSDGVEFTSDDIVYTCEMTRKFTDKLPRSKLLNGLYKTVTKVDRYTFDVETTSPEYYFAKNWGVWTWGAFALWIVPKHVYEKQPDPSLFKDSQPLSLGAYVLDKFDPNGFWHLWRLRDDWQRSSWQAYTRKAPGPKYVLYQNIGPEDKQILAFIQNKLDAATFMTSESIKAVQQRNKLVRTFAPEFPLYWMDDACAFGVSFNAQKAPYDNKDVRWALALALDLKQATMSALGGAFRVSAIPMVDQPWMKKAFFDPLIPWLENFALDDGYRPFNRKHADEMKAILMKQKVEDLPKDGEATYTMLGAGWWKHDLAQSAKLLAKAGFTKGSDGKWRLPDGKPWQPVFAIPGDWHPILQRMGFAIADSWKKAGIDVVAKQMDNAEWQRTGSYNNMMEIYLSWPVCSYISPVQFMKNYRQSFLQSGDSSAFHTGNNIRWDNKAADKLIGEMLALPPDNPKVTEMQKDVLKMMIQDMAVINLASIPTTIPQNWTYWKGWPTSDNYYAAPLTWWSSFKHVLMRLEPTGKQ